VQSSSWQEAPVDTLLLVVVDDHEPKGTIMINEKRDVWHAFFWKFLLMMLLLVSVVLVSPAHSVQGRLGFFGGLNVANLGQDADELGDDLASELQTQLGGSWSSSKESKFGLGLGMYYFLRLKPSVGLQVEAQYVRRGVGYDITEASTGTVDTHFKLDYFEVPVLLRLTPPTSGPVEALFLVGPVIGFQASADLRASAMGQSNSEDVSDAFNSVSFGALGGVGMSILVGGQAHIVLQGRYFLGLTNVLDDPSGTYSARPNDFGFFAGMEFGIGD
jgi:hypothetical protein